ncbi:hypothetical protein PVE_R2G0621 [Pseudomonas veronii 1YdBTEX2]|uniref:Uncharacterized protein n=1 Tax=Pseudomonas veronii 1YdBTEX2 TaxID=1295141 RepID=A0A1D3K8K4_PSEVE|nr:hypothetical protein PVE_R2G0621 [Pseudomonas veronii 1YdBTEX2]
MSEISAGKKPVPAFELAYGLKQIRELQGMLGKKGM